MAAGTPLTDQDRVPWLLGLATVTAGEDTAGRSTVLACSALRRAYRDVLRSRVPQGSTFLVELDAEPVVLAARMTARRHFMPVALLQSQLVSLEPLEPDELGIRIAADQPIKAIVEVVLAALETTAAPNDHWRAAEGAG